MAKAKKIKRQTEKEAKKELKESGELKGKSRSEKKRLIRVAALNKRSYLDDQGVRRSGQKPLEGIMTSRPKAVNTASKASTPVVSKFPDAKQTAENNKRVLSNQKAEAAVKPGETYIRIMKDGTKKKVRKPKVKSVKKAPGGATMGKKKMPMYNNGGKLPPSAVEKQQELVDKLTKQYDANRISIYPQGARGKEIAQKLEEATLKLKELQGGGSGRIYKLGEKNDKGIVNKYETPFKKYMNYKASKKKKAMYGSKVRAVKKAPGGAAMKKMSMYADGGKMPKYEKGGALKEVPSEAKGLSKLPKSVRNKMGYMKDGGSMKKAMYGAKMKKKAMYGAKMKKK